jgi:cation transport regulator ChaC
MAFKIPEEEVETTVNYLNIREQAGYQLETVEFHPDDGSESFSLEVYISINHPENIYYEPYASVERIVETVSGY